MRAKLGRVLVIAAWVLAAGLAAAAIPLAWTCYMDARNSTGFLDGLLAIVLAFYAGIGLLPAIGFIVLGIWASRRQKPFMVFGLLYIVVVLTVLASNGIGHLFWTAEFERNRRIADRVVEALAMYRQENGEYPTTLPAVPPEGRLTLRMGDEEIDLDYERPSSGRFVLSYDYGWYFYVYESNDPGWQMRD